MIYFGQSLVVRVDGKIDFFSHPCNFHLLPKKYRNNIAFGYFSQLNLKKNMLILKKYLNARVDFFIFKKNKSILKEKIKNTFHNVCYHITISNHMS